MSDEPISRDAFEAHADSERTNLLGLTDRLRKVEKKLDTRASPWPWRLWWRIDGWPGWPYLAERRAWRPWHRDRWPWRH